MRPRPPPTEASVKIEQGSITHRVLDWHNSFQ
jgi:hypothetical protein